ncbi:aldehyde dehydrogenase family protein [Nostocaceae cyanobacterium CENA369]|uniref:Aldehyde dehydrogenase family protein n=1 Tax=Dendronalium phyllosphericum CENA369 TaxID=1725256 RepID=A0A8J7IA61_9NOST|nr:aldehyde dehydrogenase family protein [Dendronalium phyllosphericum]MBH8577420.1 aldehyde dehydrogenase family protein [Dendronalium phyllosphericum CENA369]
MMIPAITGRRKGYTSVETKKLVGFEGSLVGEATITPPLLINTAARRQVEALKSCSIRQLLDIFHRAGKLFCEGQPDGLAPEDYVRSASLTSGLPISIVRRRTLGFFPQIFQDMEKFLLIQSPGGLDVFDTHLYQVQEILVGLVPRGNNVGFIMPGNHPSTNYMWLSALAMKMPLILRPSYDDVFTPYRLLMSLLEAGLPEESVAFVPGTHELVDTIAQAASLSVIFGGQQLQERYAKDCNIKVYGPGRSKVVVPANADFDRSVDTICRLIMDDGGRGCINCSAVIVEGNAEKLAAAVSEKLKQVPVLYPLEEGAKLGALASIASAEPYSALIDARLHDGAKEWTDGKTNRVAQIDRVAIMLPTVVEVPDFQHPLFGVELPFPFAVFTSVGSRQEAIQAARNSLAVVVSGEDKELAQELLLEPDIDKVFMGGALSTEFDPREPHEGFLLDFLFQKKAFQAGKAASYQTTI